MSQNQAVMPPSRIKLTLGDLEVGSKAYTVPWMLYVDSERRCWLDVSATYEVEPGGTVTMSVTRTHEGYHVRVPRDEQFQITETIPERCVPVLSI